ncbi:MAG TPA: hypothetical protein VE173_15360, partial [Longimicrobiales bacterium]|nr:hypothetical protein [Longimicrobiales bacterium]
ATAYLVFDDHRRGNWETYLFRTADYGASWERLPTRGVEGFAHDLEEDPVEPNLLFLGTEFGLYVSLDRGRSWTLWTSNGLPPAPVRESRVHPRDGDLVVGTHGRGAWIVDDIRPLRELASDPSLAAAAIHAFRPPPAYLHEVAEAIGYRSTGHAMWQGATRPYGALVSYWVGGPLAEDGVDGEAVRITVLDAAGARVRTLEGPAGPGIGRVVWNLRAGPDAEGDVPAGAEVLPGTYSVSVSLAGRESTATVEVSGDPRREVTMAERRARARALAVLERWSGTLDEARDRIREARSATDEVLSMLSSSDQDASLRQRGVALRDTLEAVDGRLFSGPGCQGICGGEPVASRVGAPRRRIASTPGAPTPLERLMMDQAHAALAEVVDEVNRVLRDHVAPWARAVRSSGVAPFPSTTPIALPGGGP